jgi:hypothetical protein
MKATAGAAAVEKEKRDDAEQSVMSSVIIPVFAEIITVATSRGTKWLRHVASMIRIEHS